MQGLNKVTLIGYLGKDPELRTTHSGKMVASFSLATLEGYKDGNGERQTKTEWHNVVAWGKIGELVSRYLKKGSGAYVEGKTTTRSYEKNGVKHYRTEIIARLVVFLDRKSDRRETDAPAEGGAGDLPF